MRTWLFIAAICGAIAVALGAFGAHGLAERLDTRALAAFETGARYQMYHALAIGLAAVAGRGRAAAWAARSAAAFLVGVLLFSGSLYALSLTGARILGMVTPLGGAAFIAGWILLAVAALKLEPANQAA